MNVKQQIARRSKMKAKTEKLRAEFWSEVADEDLWVRGPNVKEKMSGTGSIFCPNLPRKDLV